MEYLVSLFLGSVLQAPVLITESRQVVGLIAAALAAMLAARLGWHGTDRLIAWRGRTDQD
ncbi:hypothetical protein DZF91_06745 [Actinomadura logoneensis]|uniref:Uncharacterized protein n=1 Tax=Actinomadura logoneensis TaxID=2293572 RepID=A0A372JRI5_9ACTN|nr:hypothetical protein [Actinomadura logoneensis]RFU42406.1 hypothetical protein DZF91_06745 [Actinomadura logoneensis]